MVCSNYTNISNFHTLEVVGRGGETQIQLGDNLKKTWLFYMDCLKMLHCRYKPKPKLIPFGCARHHWHLSSKLFLSDGNSFYLSENPIGEISENRYKLNTCIWPGDRNLTIPSWWAAGGGGQRHPRHAHFLLCCVTTRLQRNVNVVATAMSCKAKKAISAYFTGLLCMSIYSLFVSLRPDLRALSRWARTRKICRRIVLNLDSK